MTKKISQKKKLKVLSLFQKLKKLDKESVKEQKETPLRWKIASSSAKTIYKAVAKIINEEHITDICNNICDAIDKKDRAKHDLWLNMLRSEILTRGR